MAQHLMKPADSSGVTPRTPKPAALRFRKHWFASGAKGDAVEGYVLCSTADKSSACVPGKKKILKTECLSLDANVKRLAV